MAAGISGVGRIVRRIGVLEVAAGTGFAALKLLYAARAVFGDGPAGLPCVIVGADTELYLRSADAPLASKALFAGIEPFGYPLFLKAVGSDWRIAVVVQTLVSIAAWAWLAWSVRALVAHRAAAVVGELGILAAGLAASFQVYDAAISTESLSVSLLVATTAAAVRFGSGATRRRVVVFLVFLGLAATTRDTNAVIALTVAGIAVVGLVLRRGEWRRLAAVAGVGVLIGLAALGSAQVGRRWYLQTVDTVAIRLVGTDDSERFLVARGLPMSPAVQELHDDFEGSYPELVAGAPRFVPYLDWIDTDGRGAYLAYLLRHPGYVLGEPLAHVDEMMLPDQGYLGVRFGCTIKVDPVTRRLGAVGLPEVVAVAFAWTVLAGLGIARFALRGVGAQRNAARWVALLGLTTIPHVLAVYHGDALELGRHSLGVAAHLRIFTWLATAVLIDVVLERRAQSRAAKPTGHDAPVPPKPQ